MKPGTGENYGGPGRRSAGRRSSLATLALGRRLIFSPPRRHRKGEGTSDLAWKFRPRATADGLDGFSHDAESESGSRRVSNGLVVCSIELTKEMFAPVRGNSDSIVRDTNYDLAIVLGVGSVDRCGNR